MLLQKAQLNQQNKAGINKYPHEFKKKSMLRRRGFPVVMIIQLAEQLLSAVKHIHERCWLHRDLKPGNIMISEAVKDSVLSFAQKDGELTMSRK